MIQLKPTTRNALKLPGIPTPGDIIKPTDPTPDKSDAFATADRNRDQYLNKPEIDNAVSGLKKKFVTLDTDVQKAGEALAERRTELVKGTPRLARLNDELRELSPKDPSYESKYRQFKNKVERVASKDPEYQSLKKDVDSLIDYARDLTDSIQRLEIAQRKFEGYAGADNRLSRSEFEQLTDPRNLIGPE